MREPAYVSIAGTYARLIRGGDLSPGIQLPSHAEMAEKHGVSDIVVRKAMELLRSQGLVRTVRRRGIFVADRANLVRISPERQMQSPEVSFGAESEESVDVHRETAQVSATDELADIFGVQTGDELVYVITRVSSGGHPVSISDTYHRVGANGAAGATVLEETLADKMPTKVHAEWLRTPVGALVKTVRQEFRAVDGQMLMISDISYPQDRYDAFVFRMNLNPDS
ncbi:GntR family transcriptional regulator [Actinokineospora enzanensis]|uniref:GntR family transcriptional regulator n=1 Tax=Actinokineospora enzanensis TaxID=155975 RepID=UPI000366AE57|nr:GntR family transcriptional regulator [Actinokineospora enzanensis]